ncbi:uncharacterized protein LOC134673927 [Cydia fagiglandana]|uniref:uncharacterized protein LOC134673927 n=1 Tax=Cydia fagiglandana TaxID=1458189 RepID=UPI002FEE392C
MACPYRIDNDVKKKIIDMKNYGFPVTDIVNELGIARNTVYLWLERWEQEGGLNNHVSFRRPRSTTRLQDVNIIEKARNERFINTTQFSGVFNVSSSTIRRLKEGGLQNRVPTRKPALTQRHIDERLHFAVTNRNKNFDDDIFMDNKIFSSSDNGRLALWKPDNTRYHARHLVPDRRSGRITNWLLGLDVKGRTRRAGRNNWADECHGLCRNTRRFIPAQCKHMLSEPTCHIYAR